MKEKLGIGHYGSLFLDVNHEQDKENELIFIQNFILDFIQKNDFSELKNKKYDYEFINYGDTELVFVIKTEDSKYYTMLINQPSTKKDIVKNEYNNLNKFSKSNKFVIKPLYYFEKGDKALYLTPYIYQARCIASKNNNFGLYVPEPIYHFTEFNDHERKIVNAAMIANVIKLYNEKESLGLCDIKFGGGDFILEKEWDNESKNIDNTLKRMKLIAARNQIKISFEDYLNLLRKELVQRTYYYNKKDRDKNILLNLKARLPMTKEEIEEGIALGLKLR